MVILHYMFGIPPVRGGGLVRYATDLMVQQKKLGEQVFLLLPGTISLYKNRKTRICRGKPYQQISTYVIQNPLPIPMGNGILADGIFVKNCNSMVYRTFLQQIKPSVIHIHTLMGLHREFFAEASKLKIPVVFTTHDYFGICPTAMMLLEGHICRDIEWKQCFQCCQNAYSEKRLLLEQSALYRFYRRNKFLVSFVHHANGRMLGQVLHKLMAPTPAVTRRMDAHIMQTPKTDEDNVQVIETGGTDYKRLRAYYREIFGMVSFFHFNSSMAKSIYESRLGELAGSVLAVSHSGISDLRRKRVFENRLVLGYFGNKSVHKGYDSLLHACENLYAEGNRDFELHLYFGTNRRKRESEFAIDHSYFSQSELANILKKLDVLVVPSQWPETFGLVVLEAISHGVPVVVSEHVGAKDILDPYSVKSLVYDGSQEGLERTLRKIYNDRKILEQANTSILEMEYDFSYETNVKEILGVYRGLLRPRD